MTKKRILINLKIKHSILIGSNLNNVIFEQLNTLKCKKVQ